MVAGASVSQPLRPPFCPIYGTSQPPYIPIPCRLFRIFAVELNKTSEMNSVMIDLWPYLFPALLAGIAGLVGWVHNLRTRVAILENTVEKQQERLDSHSKKQDEVLVKMNSMEREVLKEVSGVNVRMQDLRGDVKALTQLISFCDKGYRISPAELEK